ncbi:hypothetical protein Tco_0717665 [Tanacetum coccineum]
MLHLGESYVPASGRYPTSVRVFLDPILFLAGLKPSWEYALRNFIYTEDDEDLSFLPKEPSPGFGTGSSSVSINTKPLKANKVHVIQPVEVTTDSGESPKPELFVVRPGSVATQIKDRKCLPDVLELKDATACHLKISAVTPPT